MFTKISKPFFLKHVNYITYLKSYVIFFSAMMVIFASLSTFYLQDQKQKNIINSAKEE